MKNEQLIAALSRLPLDAEVLIQSRDADSYSHFEGVEFTGEKIYLDSDTDQDEHDRRKP